MRFQMGIAAKNMRGQTGTQTGPRQIIILIILWLTLITNDLDLALELEVDIN